MAYNAYFFCILKYISSAFILLFSRFLDPIHSPSSATHARLVMLSAENC